MHIYPFPWSPQVAKVVVDVALLHALVPLQLPSTSSTAASVAGGSGGGVAGSGGNSATEMSVLVDSVQVEKALLANDKIKKLLLQVCVCVCVCVCVRVLCSLCVCVCVCV